MENKKVTLLSSGMQVCRYLFQNRFLTVNTGVIYALLIVFVSFHLRPVAEFCIAQKVAVTPWVFPFMTSDYMLQILLVAGAILLVADVPFQNENQLYLMYRTGTVGWQLGTFFYMALAALVYVVSIWGIALLSLADVLQFSGEWGKILGTLMQTTAGVEYGVPMVFNYTIFQYSPIQATLYALSLEALCILWLGMVAYIGNVYIRHRAGVLIAFLYLFLDVMAFNVMPRNVYQFSPLSLCQLGYFDGDFARVGVSLSYAFGFFTLSITGFSTVILLTENRRRIMARLGRGVLHIQEGRAYGNHH